MFAVIKTGGKQFKVQVGQTIDVEKLDAEEGTEIRIDDVLLAADGAHVSYGRPLIDGATVTARVVSQHRGPKLVVFKYKSKARYRRRTGHRQSLTMLQIQSIAAPGFDTVVAPEQVEYVPIETTAVEAAPIETRPVEATAVETTPIEAMSVETTPVETTPIETTPIKTTPGEPTRIATAALGSSSPADDVLTPAGPIAQIDPHPGVATTPEIDGDATLPTPGSEQFPTE